MSTGKVVFDVSRVYVTPKLRASIQLGLNKSRHEMLGGVESFDTQLDSRHYLGDTAKRLAVAIESHSVRREAIRQKVSVSEVHGLGVAAHELNNFIRHRAHLTVQMSTHK
jgi:hypothetical protein